MGHESLSSPLFRLADNGALVRLPGTSSLSGTHWRIGGGGMADFSEGGDHWTLAGRADWKRAPAAPDLDFANLSGDLMWRPAFGGGQAGFGVGREHLRVAGRRFRESLAAKADWTRGTPEGGHWALLGAATRQRHPLDPDLDGVVASLSVQRHLPAPWPGLASVDLELAYARERNGRGLSDLSSRNRFFRISADRRWAGLDWSAGIAIQRASFDAALLPGLPARRDRGAALELSASMELGGGASLRLEFTEARNRSNLALFENRYRLVSMTLARGW